MTLKFLEIAGSAIPRKAAFTLELSSYLCQTLLLPTRAARIGMSLVRS